MKTYIIKNIDCESCARKVEEHLKKNTNAENVSVNIISNKMLIDDRNLDAKQLERLVNQIENGVEIKEVGQSQGDVAESNFDRELIAMMISFGLLLLGFITKFEVVYLIGYLIVGLPVVKLAFKNIIHRQFFDEYFLMTLATFAAIGIGEYSEALAVMLFYSVGEYIQQKTLDKTKSSITELSKLNVRNAVVVHGQHQHVVPIEDLQVGDLILVPSGERIGVDSKLVSTVGYVDSSHITGESEPQTVQTGDDVFAGSVNVGDPLHLEVIATADDSMIAKLIELVTYAESKKTKTEQFITRFSKVYTPIVVMLAMAIVVLFPPLFAISYEEAIYRAVTLLVISCPCAFVLSVPLGYVVTIGHLARKHILVKGSMAIDRLKNITVLAVDKTGTLTTGNFVVTDFTNYSSLEDQFIHSLVNGAEQNVTHPIAKSLIAYTKGYPKLVIENISHQAGRGLSFEYQNDSYTIRKNTTNKVMTMSDLYCGQTLLASYGLSDQIKTDSYQFVSQLEKLQIKLLMLTGDNSGVATDVGNKLGINDGNIHADLMPEDKLQIVEREIESGQVVGFAGDGLNDAAVIKRSDIGIAMGARGSELSIESSDVVISDDNISKIIDAIYISRFSDIIIKQNITFAFAVKVIFILLGIVGITTMWEAVFSDVGVTLIAIANSMRIKRR